MAYRILKKGDIQRLILAVTEKGGLFVAPKACGRQAVYTPLFSAEEMTCDYILPRNSFKEYLFPQTEVIARYAIERGSVSLEGVEAAPPEVLIFGSRPCDAASAASLRAVFTWDYEDTFYTRREDRTTVISIACTRAADTCFCTTVGLKPDSREGSDILLRETEEGDYIVDVVTDKGRAFTARFAGILSEIDEGVGSYTVKDTANLPKIEGVDVERIREWLKDTGNYEDPLWAELARKCIGCGACTFVCPTCHCFDIMDEGTALEGERRKNWDSCQFDYFTLHASGHNPRDTQYKRWRNRFMCRFNFYPNKFASTGCVGCGRCIDVCPVRLDITEVMEEISENK